MQIVGLVGLKVYGGTRAGRVETETSERLVCGDAGYRWRGRVHERLEREGPYAVRPEPGGAIRFSYSTAATVAGAAPLLSERTSQPP
jgi:hypothetical protein